jgi:hypothetical protein
MDDKRLGMLLNLGSAVLIIMLVWSFIHVINTALHVAH